MEFLKDIHFSPDIEASVLGICLLERDAFARIFDLVDKETFYHDANQTVFATMSDMFQSGLPVEILSVSDYLMRSIGIKELASQTVPYYLSILSNAVVSSATLEYFCHCLQEMWTKRELIKLTYGGVKDDDVRASMSRIRERLHYIQGKSVVNEWKSMDELIVGLYKHQDKMQATKGMGIMTGFKSIDQRTGGFHPQQLIVIGARPSVGKSALAGQMAIQIARQGHKVGIISLEMSNNEIAARIASIDALVNFDVLFRALWRDEQQRDEVYKKLNSQTAKLPIFVSDKTNVNINEIRAKANKLKAKYGCDILMIDYLQLVQGEEKNMNREQQVSKISRGCKIMAKELDIPVIELCQLSREVTKRKGTDRYPQLSDLRESGSIEQDADVVMFLHSDWMSGVEVDENGLTTESSRDLVIRKWRNSSSNWMVSLEFDAPKMMFRESNNFIPVAQIHYQEKHEQDNPF